MEYDFFLFHSGALPLLSPTKISNFQGLLSLENKIRHVDTFITYKFRGLLSLENKYVCNFQGLLDLDNKIRHVDAFILVSSKAYYNLENF